ncbi:MAG TPA: hypothetical protein VHS09_02005, partial [Polyangiaceae bacterium]|nr:hypothetical protein [Polyangiaceae bacterium]
TMPVMDGWEFRRRQLCDHRFASIPVVLLSGERHTTAAVARLRALSGLEKPYSVARLLEVLDDSVKRASSAPPPPLAAARHS